MLSPFLKKLLPRFNETFFYKTGNFPTLLCLGDQCHRHGPIWWYWEGTSKRFIQQLKKLLVTMRRTKKNVSGNLAKMHKMNLIDWLDERLRGRPILQESR